MQSLIKGERLMRYAVNIMIRGNVESFSFGLHPSKLHYDIGVAEFQGIKEFMELRKSADILELRGS
jgi:hypothetical protein